jgi:hypothetical protein
MVAAIVQETQQRLRDLIELVEEETDIPTRYATIENLYDPEYIVRDVARQVAVETFNRCLSRLREDNPDPSPTPMSGS